MQVSILEGEVSLVQLWRVHIWPLNGCIVIQFPVVIIWEGKKKSKSMVWDNKYLFNEACSLHTQFFVSFICSSVSLDLGRPSRCSKTFPWIFFFSPLRAMTFYISCKDCIVYCRDICFLKYSLALCWFMFCNLKVL